MCELVMQRCFSGSTVTEHAEELNISYDEEVRKHKSEQGENIAPAPGEEDGNACIVTCRAGTYIGATEKGISSFKGIEYAKLPEDGRWKEATPLEPSEERFGATLYGKVSPQCPSRVSSSWMYEKSEACQNLNIWRNEKYKGEELRPVLVYLDTLDDCVGGSADARNSGDRFVRRDMRHHLIQHRRKTATISQFSIKTVSKSELWSYIFRLTPSRQRPKKRRPILTSQWP